jgi:hypothetical protein
MQVAGHTEAHGTQPSISVEDEVLGNLRGQPLGVGKVEDLALPEAYLRRVGDRIIRSSFEERWRIVLPDAEVAKNAEASRAAAHVGAAAPEAQREWLAPLLYGVGALVVVFVVLVATTRKKRAA